MERNSHPLRLFHGTPYEIHTSKRPFLDPRFANGHDEDDPQQGGYIFATPDLLIASIFAFKDNCCKSIVRTEKGPVAVFANQPPDPNTKGLVYEVPPEGFTQTMRRGQPSGKWVMLDRDMPLVRDSDNSETPGIPIARPIRRVIIRDLVEQEHLRICILTGAVDTALYDAAIRDALHLGVITTFIDEAIERGWLHDVTHTFLDENPGEATPIPSAV